MLLVEGFQKFAGIPFGISRIFESLIPQQISANRRKNRSIQVLVIIAFWAADRSQSKPRTKISG
ncbi:MAG: hypothetical protein PVH61_22090 [Candidatus Aminicenantes bacterium]|jgi:hypothetical protein